MKHKLNYLFLVIALMTQWGWNVARAGDIRTGYAINNNEDYTKGIFTFEMGDTINDLKLWMPLTFNQASGGRLIGDTYYYIDYTQTDNGYEVNGLYAVNMDDQSVRLVADYGAANMGAIASCFAYDYQEQAMYGLGSFNGGSTLVKIDLDNGNISTVGEVQLDYINATAQSYGYDHLHVMATNYDGDTYAVSYWGSLYKVNTKTCTAQYVADLDYNPGQAFMYTSDDLFFDNNNEQLYLRYTTYDWSTYSWLYEVVKIDVKTGHVDRFAQNDMLGSMLAVSIPFTPAEASAPAKVQNLSITRGEAGALTTTLSWDNPDKTFGRGGTLEDLDYVLVFRDNELVDSIVNPVIGGHQTWTDDNITERGYYTYKVIAGNDMGRGDRNRTGIYVGKGDPMPVTDLTVQRNGSGATISWTAPTEGKTASYIDIDELNYDVLRYRDSNTEPETVATAVKETTFEDKSIETMGKYIYAVIPHTANATGQAVKTEAFILGPAYTIPATFGFNSQDEFNLWTVIDANGNYTTWQWSEGYYGSIRGAQCRYNYDEIIAADWLISPRVKMEAGKHYKMTFDALSGSKKVLETLAITMGKGTTIEQQDSVTQFDILAEGTQSYRANLPVVDDTDEYNVGFYYRSYVANYNLSVGNVVISEDHEGYIDGHVTCGGKAVAGATVISGGGAYIATTDKEGYYKLNYLPEGEYTVQVIALGYEDYYTSETVTEWQTTTADIALTALPMHTVKGVVKDVAGDPVAGAKVTLYGYDSKETSTAADGSFSFSNVFENSNYAVKIVKNKLLDGQKSFAVDGDIDLGDITLLDNQKPAGKVTVTETETGEAQIEWRAPANDAVVQRIDDGTLTTCVGIADATDKTLFGVVKREPALVSGAEFYIDGTSSVTHDGITLTIFDLDENGNPTDKVLYQNTYVSCKDGQWNSYMLPAPVDCPNGYYMALSYYGYLLVGIDGAGDAEQYPFVEGVNCFTPDYTTGNYLYLEGQTNEAFHHNFLIRPVAAPYTVAEDATEFTAPLKFNNQHKGEYVELQHKAYTADQLDRINASQPAMHKTPQSRIRYNLYRMKAADMGNEATWTLLSEQQQTRDYTDAEWSQLAQGSYAYAVKAVYTGDYLAAATLSDSIGNKMLTDVTVRLTTNTPENEAYGAKVTLIAGGGRHVSMGYADDNGMVVIPDVWKAEYDLVVELDGFNTLYETVDLSKDNSYDLSYKLTEHQVTPYNLIIADTENANEKEFIWNYPDVFFDDFEEHDDFAINSPGAIGWQYIDGDGGETGGVYGYTWPGQFEPMAFIVFNPSATTPSCYDAFWELHAYSGNKCLQDWAPYGVQNDDWIITPQLHFQKDINISFWAKCYDYNYLEAFEVLYSTTDAQPESFIVARDSSECYSYWQKYSVDIPKEAKYIAIRCISNGKRVFMLDDIQFGLADAAPYYIARPSTRKSGMHRAPSLDGLYEVYLDGEMIAQQDETSIILSNLSTGQHTAGVIASYTSGQTEMSTIDFTVDSTSGVSINNVHRDMTLRGRTLTLADGYTDVTLYNAAGVAYSFTANANGQCDLSHLPQGAYIVKTSNGRYTRTMKITLKQ